MIQNLFLLPASIIISSLILELKNILKHIKTVMQCYLGKHARVSPPWVKAPTHYNKTKMPKNV